MVRLPITIEGRGRNWKTAVRWGLGVVLALDLLLLVAVWRSNGQQDRAGELERLRVQHKQLAADAASARLIRERLPLVRAQCDAFFEQQLSPAAGGYSRVVADLGAIAARAGLRASGVTFKEQPIAHPGVVEVEVRTVVEGDYASLVRFINGLERSENFYLLHNLSLVSTTTGGIKLNLELRTYFRS